MRIQKKNDVNGNPRYYASVVHADRIKGKVVQKTVVYIGAVDEDQIPYLKAAYSKEKPTLTWKDGTSYP